jgi:hypothetical protein
VTWTLIAKVLALSFGLGIIIDLVVSDIIREFKK